MARKSTEERYGEWCSRISIAEKELEFHVDEWDANLKRYRGEYQYTDDPQDDSVRINHQFALARIILPSVYFQNPDVMCIPRGITPLPIANVREQILNHQFELQDVETEFRDTIFDSLFCGLGWIKQGFGDIELTGPKTEVDEYSDMFNEPIIDEDLWDGAKLKKDADLSTDQRIMPQMPFLIRVDPRFILIDPLATNIKTARWVCHKILKPVSEVKKDKRYSRRIASGIEGHLAITDQKALNSVPHWNRSANYSGNRTGGFKEELVMLYEIWDREKNKFYVLDSYNKEQGTKKFLREEDNPYSFDGYPFEPLIFNHDPSSPFGLADAEVWRNPTDAMNLLDTMQYNHVKRFNRKYIMSPGAFKEEELDKLQSPVDGAMVEATMPPSEAIMPLADATVTPDLYNLGMRLQERLDSVSGTSEQRRGNTDKGATATEASIVEQHSRVIDNDRLSLVSKFVGKCAKKQDKLNQQFLTNKYVSFLTDPASATLWSQSPEEVLNAEVAVKIRVGSSGFISRDMRNQQLMQYFNIVGGQVYPDGSPVANIPEFIRRIGEALQQPDVDALVNPAPPGMFPPSQDPRVQAQQAQQQGQPGGPITNDKIGGSMGDALAGMQNAGMQRTAPNPSVERNQQ